MSSESSDMLYIEYYIVVCAYGVIDTVSVKHNGTLNSYSAFETQAKYYQIESMAIHTNTQFGISSKIAKITI